MTPITFGTQQRPLFGLYHPPAAAGRGVGVVLCNSFGQEAMRAHRAVRQLALELTRARLHVLRFDLYGCGDSGGEGFEGHTEEWMENLHAASDELKDTAGVSKVAWVGLRWGATVALRASVGRKDLDALVLWDPVVNGAAYLAELRRMHLDFLQNDMGAGFRPGPRGRYEEVAGFPLGDRLVADLEAHRLEAITSAGGARASALFSADGPDLDATRAALRPLYGAALRVRSVPTAVRWNTEEAVTAALVPADLIAAVAEEVTGGGTRGAVSPS
mgnify:CR=1 FL=1